MVSGEENVSRGWMDANFVRSQVAAERDVERAREAMEAIYAVRVRTLDRVDIVLRQRYLKALRQRVIHPNDSLQMLADRMGISKATYAARLRRAFKFAERMSHRGS